MKARLRSFTRQPVGLRGDSVRRQRGFSLVQMLVVVSIVCLVSGIAAPIFLNSARPMRLRNDAHALANLITMARMRASTEFAHVEVYCTPSPTSGPAYCQLKSLGFNVTNLPANWVNEPQTVYLSENVSFGIPPTINTPVLNQPTGTCPFGSASAYQGDAQQYTPCATANTTNPVIVFNSRGMPVDPTGSTGNNGTVVTPDYALYLKDTTNNYYAVSVNYTGHPTLYSWNPNPTALAFTRLLEYNDGSTQ